MGLGGCTVVVNAHAVVEGFFAQRVFGVGEDGGGERGGGEGVAGDGVGLWR